MSITNGYCTLAAIKTRLGISDTTDDAVLEALVESVSRAFDDFCQRQFYASTQTRHYTANSHRCLLVDDLLSVTTLKTDADADGAFEATWAATDFVLAPYNAQLEPVPQPYTGIQTTPYGNNWFPCGVPRGVEITGSWGFSATTPKAVENACLFQVALEHRSSAAPLGNPTFGETSTGAVAQETRLTALHPVTRRLLEPYRRIVVA